jgi:hypothetical protein
MMAALFSLGSTIRGNLPTGEGSPLPASVACTPCYRQPRLTLVGTVTRLVQSGPTGNRYETYRCSYWYDR